MMKQTHLNHLQIQLPKITSLLFAGSAFYIGFIDPSVRQSHSDKKEQLNHWSNLYHYSKYVMGGLVIASTLFGLNAYRLTKQPLWLYGSGSIFSIFPFTIFSLMKTNGQLEEDGKKYQSNNRAHDKQIQQRLQRWVSRHRIRVLLSFVGFGLFFIASSKESTTQLIQNAAIRSN